MRYQKHLVNKIFEFAKFALTIGLFCFLIVKVPNEVSQIINAAALLVIGGSKLRSWLGFGTPGS